MINKKKICSTTTPPGGGIPKVGTTRVRLFLTEESYAAATSSENEFKIDAKVSYSGVLGEELDAYETSEKLFYSSVEGVFRYAEPSNCKQRIRQ